MDERSSTTTIFGGYSVSVKYHEKTNAPDDEPWELGVLKPDGLPIPWEGPFKSRASAQEKAEAIVRDHAELHGRTVPDTRPVWEEV